MKIGRNIATQIAAHTGIATAHQDAPALVNAHVIAVDPHGDRAYADGLIAALAPSFEEIAEVSLTAPAASVEVAGIAAGYAAFLLIWSDVYGDNAAAQALYLTFNADGGANYDYSEIAFNAATSTVHAAAFIYIGRCGDTAGVELHDSGFLIIFNRAANEKLTIGTSVEVQEAGGNVEDAIGRHLEGKWRNVAAEISTVTITPSVGNFVAGSRFVLLGVKT